jgi:hypothetical protein
MATRRAMETIPLLWFSFELFNQLFKQPRILRPPIELQMSQA